MTVRALLVLVLAAGAADMIMATAVGNDTVGDRTGGVELIYGNLRFGFIAGPNASCPWLASMVDESQETRTTREMCTSALPVDFQGLLHSMNSSEGSFGDKSQPLTPTANSAQEKTSANNTNVPSGYTHLAGVGVYKVHEEKMTWHEAKATCEEERGHLVIVDSKNEAAAIRNLLKSQRSWWRERPFTLHAGFSMEFRTPNGMPLSYLRFERWALKQPAAPICGRIDHDAWLLFGPCSQRERFVCEYEQKERGPSIKRNNQDVFDGMGLINYLQVTKSGYTQVRLKGGARYKRYDMTLDIFRGNPWEDARRACQKDGALLALLMSAAEAEEVVDFFQGLPDDEPRGDTLIALRTTEPVDVLGYPVSASGYHLWVEKIFPNSCLCIDIKAMFRTCSCEDVSLSFLCKYPQFNY